jgi:periplasmic protein TonB
LATVVLQAALILLIGITDLEEPKDEPHAFRTAIRFVVAAAEPESPPPEPKPPPPEPEPPAKTKPPEPVLENPPKVHDVATAEERAARPAEPPGPPVPATAVSEAKNVDLLLSALTALIERYKNYPRAAQRARLEGDVRVKVLVDAGGKVQSYDLIESSGHRILDRATLAIFERIKGKRIAANEMDRALEIVAPIRYARR